jgi:hypothetical protein
LKQNLGRILKNKMLMDHIVPRDETPLAIEN